MAEQEPLKLPVLGSSPSPCIHSGLICLFNRERGQPHMKITACLIKTVPPNPNNTSRLRGFAMIVVDSVLAIHEIRIVELAPGEFHIAMPSRQAHDRCPRCNHGTPIRAKFCGDCGVRLADGRIPANISKRGQEIYYYDVAHPVTTMARGVIKSRIMMEYHAEVKRSKIAGYQSAYDLLQTGQIKFSDVLSAPLAPIPQPAQPLANQSPPPQDQQ